ncbi:MAG: nucleotidyltransferase domain-containing protein [Candidatus Delongbacteria bacterium]|nr:nucleotidyltransferase domain-containing protein [Candidatus Delongbacteria bacterium]MCG2761014.1 nucleotidyltransferase domain-containing protein [Candidatus Delongbacteria bacterium]
MSKEAVLKILRTFREKNGHRFHLLKLGLFGSYAKGTQNENSDIDIVVEIPKQDFFELFDIKQELEKDLKKSVDVISYREKMNGFLKKRIEKEAIYV